MKCDAEPNNWSAMGNIASRQDVEFVTVKAVGEVPADRMLRVRRMRRERRDKYLLIIEATQVILIINKRVNKAASLPQLSPAISIPMPFRAIQVTYLSRNVPI
jgi:hypothetical protein